MHSSTDVELGDVESALSLVGEGGRQEMSITKSQYMQLYISIIKKVAADR